MGISDRIAVAVDFSEASKIALRAAFRFTQLVGAKRLTLLHSVRPVVFPAGSQPVVRARLEALRERIHRAAEEQLGSLCAECGAPSELTLEHRVVEGHPAEAIPAAAKAMQASLLLVGTHGRRGVRRWVSGSIAETMLQQVEVPTLVTASGEDGTSPQAELDRLETVLIAVDEGPQAEATARAGFDLAQSFTHARPKVVLLHVVEGTGIEVLAADDPEVSAYAELLAEAGRGNAEELAARCNPGGLDVGIEVVHGEAASAILETARRLPAQLVVIGTHGRGLAALLQIGSTAAHVVRHSDVSVLVVPHSERGK